MLHSFLPKLVLLCVLLCDVNAVKKCYNLKKDGLVPTYVDKVTPQCKVKFSKDVSAKCGNKLLFGATATEPTIKFNLPQRNCINGTIISIDPDAIGVTPPFLHELATNIPKECLKEGYNSNTCKAGDLQAPFVSPGGCEVPQRCFS
ncbi:uncharacterized protein LOC129235147 isoform X3 [Uloborus diversus]|uniref:uncharacterized protein LOC129235147 isoform X3 n=1 Tax=Uloborus diversus TaxID=327109 RepID=UPI002409AB7F|nr:uncharacterized protein LOC129235147 isoform X3 [Uloborus diversus]